MAKEVVQCSKEKELMEMSFEIKHIKKSVLRVEEGQKNIADKLDSFIEKADEKYATKDELEALRDDEKSLRDRASNVVLAILGALCMFLLGLIKFK